MGDRGKGSVSKGRRLVTRVKGLSVREGDG